MSDEIKGNTKRGFEILNQCIVHNREQNITHDVPYYQLLNWHEHDAHLEALATSYRLGSLASDLLQKESVALYQTGMFRKDPFSPLLPEIANQITSYHRDLNLVPVDTHSFVTFWCPTVKLLPGDSSLVYALGSHMDIGHGHWWGSESKPVRFLSSVCCCFFLKIILM
jgi:hypothetical protein